MGCSCRGGSGGRLQGEAGSSILFSKTQTEHAVDSISSGQDGVGAGDDIKNVSLTFS